MQTFFQDFATDDVILITVEYHYEDSAPYVDDAWCRTSGAKIKLTDAERERMELWISDNRFFDDHAPDD